MKTGRGCESILGHLLSLSVTKGKLMCSMNKKQRKIILIGFVIVIVCCLFPPWVYYTFNAKGAYSESPAGYSLIIEPPEPRHTYPPGNGVKLDVPRLLLQIFIISLSTGFGVFICQDKQKNIT
jgi:hypothetical protein